MYEFINSSIDELNRKTKTAFNNSRLRLLAFDEINAMQVKKESERLYKTLDKQCNKFFDELIQDTSKKLKFSENDFFLNDFLEEVNPVLLYSFNAEAERKRARHFEAMLAISDMSSHRVLEEQKKEVRYWNIQVEETAVDIEREVLIHSARKKGVNKVQWITMEDERVCKECADLNDKVFDIDNIPRRPHIGCRCQLKMLGGDSIERR